MHGTRIFWAFIVITAGTVLTAGAQMDGTTGTPTPDSLGQTATGQESMGGGMAGSCQQRMQEAAEPPSLQRLAKDLNLSDDQLRKLRDERVKRAKDINRWRAEIENLHLDLWNEVNSDRPNTGKIENLSSQVGERKGRILATRVNTIVFLRSLLTPEQKKQMDEIQLRMDGCGRGMGGRRMMPRPEDQMEQ